MCRKDWGRESNCRDRLVVRTLRCGRSNPGSNPGHGIFSPRELFLKEVLSGRDVTYNSRITRLS